MFDRSYRFRFYRNYLTAENAENAEGEKREITKIVFGRSTAIGNFTVMLGFRIIGKIIFRLVARTITASSTRNKNGLY